jgi:hypothetical protein
MGVALAVVLAVFLVAHVSLIGGLVRRRSWASALWAIGIPPLVPWWGWSEGMRRRTAVWTATLAAYALGTILGKVLSGW